MLLNHRSKRRCFQVIILKVCQKNLFEPKVDPDIIQWAGKGDGLCDYKLPIGLFSLINPKIVINQD